MAQVLRDEQAVDGIIESLAGMPEGSLPILAVALDVFGDQPLRYFAETIRYGEVRQDWLVRIRLGWWLRRLKSSPDGALLHARLEGAADAPWPAVRAALADQAVL